MNLLQQLRPPLADHPVEHDTSVFVVTENRNHGSLETGMKIVNCDARGDTVHKRKTTSSISQLSSQQHLGNFRVFLHEGRFNRQLIPQYIWSFDMCYRVL